MGGIRANFLSFWCGCRVFSLFLGLLANERPYLRRAVVGRAGSVIHTERFGAQSVPQIRGARKPRRSLEKPRCLALVFSLHFVLFLLSYLETSRTLLLHLTVCRALIHSGKPDKSPHRKPLQQSCRRANLFYIHLDNSLEAGREKKLQCDAVRLLRKESARWFMCLRRSLRKSSELLGQAFVSSR